MQCAISADQSVTVIVWKNSGMFFLSFTMFETTRSWGMPPLVGEGETPIYKKGGAHQKC